MEINIGIDAKHREAISAEEDETVPNTQRMQVHEKTAWMLRSLLE
jgi:DNA-binding ferritin-like protein